MSFLLSFCAIPAKLLHSHEESSNYFTRYLQNSGHQAETSYFVVNLHFIIFICYFWSTMSSA